MNAIVFFLVLILHLIAHTAAAQTAQKAPLVDQDGGILRRAPGRPLESFPFFSCFRAFVANTG